MSKYLLSLGLVALAAVSNFQAAEAEPALSTETKVELQSILRIYVDKNSSKGALNHLDLKTSKARNLYPASTHPRIFRVGEYYALCTDFKDEAGAPVDIDFYVQNKGGKLTIFQMEVGKHNSLHDLVKAGLASLIS